MANDETEIRRTGRVTPSWVKPEPSPEEDAQAWRDKVQSEASYPIIPPPGEPIYKPTPAPVSADDADRAAVVETVEATPGPDVPKEIEDLDRPTEVTVDTLKREYSRLLTLAAKQLNSKKKRPKDLRLFGGYPTDESLLHMRLNGYINAIADGDLGDKILDDLIVDLVTLRIYIRINGGAK